MPYTISNATDARSTENYKSTGRQITVDAGDGWLDLGLFNEDQSLYPTTDVQRDNRNAKDERGNTVLVKERVTGTTATYDTITLVTPSDAVRSLLKGDSVTVTGIAGATVSGFEPGKTVTVRMVNVQRSQDDADKATVLWHPRATVEYLGEDQEGLPQIRISVLSFDKETLSAAMDPYKAVLGSYGGLFEVPEAGLPAILDLIDAEAPLN
ncbi:hypothetical protein [Deinococcus sedimenti]|uniref:DUF5666 domain-containing protein n=1 Tax=Deinococcus sedimenti TaxID=1867090 RepID=A0ABQ2S1B8_9DEIO|nr:hypothetical protein [Deinococcus sedimenti]GGR84499.1 hypothetical protein GCM10008960_09430 [Deinococcus sedimenti]